MKNTQIIDEFIRRWKEQAKGWYLEAASKYNTDMAEHRKKYPFFTQESMKDWRRIQNNYMLRYGKGTLQILMHDMHRIDEILTKEAAHKKTRFIAQIEKRVGECTEAHLYIGEGGDVNGTATGLLGTATVRTITAGGYNIQCFHFRVLVK